MISQAGAESARILSLRLMFRFPRRRSTSRRLNRRILVAMLAVALLPLAALTALVGADLSAVNQSTVDAAHQTIVADAAQRESSAARAGATTIEARVEGLGGELAQLAGTVDSLLRTTAPIPQPVQLMAGGSRLLTSGAPAATLFGAQSRLLSGGGQVMDSLGQNRSQIAAALAGVLKRHPELSAVWLYNGADSMVTEVPVTDPATLAGLVANQRIDPVRLIDRQLQAALGGVQQGGATGSAGGLIQNPRTPAGPVWSDIDTAAFGPGTSVTVWTGLATSNYFIGAELPGTAIAGLLTEPVSTLPDSYQVLLSPSGRWLSAGVTASSDLSLPNGFEGTPARVPGISARSLLVEQPQVVKASLHGVQKDLFTAPIDGPHWTLASVVPDRELAPASASLGDGIRSGVRRILLLQVLPLAVVLGVIAVLLAAVFSRRLVGPVRALTASAERLARGHTDEPVPHQGEDEVGLLSEALERMRREINLSREALISAAQELEGRVAERTEELRDRNEELVALNALAATLTRSLDPGELLGGAVEAMRVIVPVTAAAGYTVADGVPELLAHHPSRLGGAAAQMGAGVAAALESGALSLRSSAAGRVVALPVAAGGAPLGAIAALVPLSVPLPKRIRILLGAVADQVGLALRTAEFAAEGRELAVLEERTRLAREIHDTLAQQLTAIVLQLEAAEAMQSRARSERSRDLIVAAREQARQALQEARRSVWNLRPMPLEAAGLTAAVALETERFGTRSGIAVTVRTDHLPRHLALSPQSEVALFRILQEALTNVGHHSHAQRVEVDLRVVGGELLLIVSDDGSGFDAAPDELAPTSPGSFGLVGMRERARLIGAELEVTSERTVGTRISVRVPLEQQDAAATA
ncbi:MAG TPA: histidine kinase [Candidatus Dormibacteraeota bacterium]|nr:histidine kinase [Candidatus Dormibacteraeota bacterium]